MISCFIHIFKLSSPQGDRFVIQLNDGLIQLFLNTGYDCRLWSLKDTEYDWTFKDRKFSDGLNEFKDKKY